MPPRPKHNPTTPAPSPRRQRLHTAAPILLAALLVTLPLLVRGNSCGHDQIFHLISWLEAAQQWTHGTLRPFWAFHPAWHAGEPRFIFYPPLSWALGALLGLLLPWVATTFAYTFLAVALCGFTMQALLRRFATPALATAGACVYVANPYLLFCVYERAAYAELLAAAWIPLLLLCLLRPRIRPLPLAAVVALLWLTNVPAAILASYTALLVVAVRGAFSLRTRPDPNPNDESRTTPLTLPDILRAAGGYILGLALAGFYLVPAVAERGLVQVGMATMPGMRPRDSFLFEHTGQDFHDAVLRHASWIAVALLATAALSATALLLRRRHQAFHSMAQRAAALHRLPLPQVATAGAVLTAVILFLLTPPSAAVWLHAPALALLQFPWRFLTVEAAIAALLLTLLAASLQLPRRAALLTALLFAAALPWFLGNTAYRQPCDEEDAPAARIANYQADDGIDPTDEYTPTDDDNDALKPDLPPAWLAASPEAAPDPATLPAVITTDDGHPAHLHFDIRPTAAEHDVIIRLRAYRGWALTVDGNPQPLESHRDDGLITLALPATGAHTVDLRYRWTADEYAGLALSITALSATVAFAPSRKMKGKAT